MYFLKFQYNLSHHAVWVPANQDTTAVMYMLKQQPSAGGVGGVMTPHPPGVTPQVVGGDFVICSRCLVLAGQQAMLPRTKASIVLMSG